MIASALAAGPAAHEAVEAAFYLDAHFWVGIGFALVVAIIYRPVVRGLAAALDARAAKIKARLDEAFRLREDAQEMLATYRRKQRDAMKEAEEIVAHAKAEAERLAEQGARDLEESLKRREKMAMERIAQAEAQAVKEVRDMAVEVAVSAAQQVLTRSISADQAAALVDGAIKELPRKLH